MDRGATFSPCRRYRYDHSDGEPAHSLYLPHTARRSPFYGAVTERTIGANAGS